MTANTLMNKIPTIRTASLLLTLVSLGLQLASGSETYSPTSDEKTPKPQPKPDVVIELYSDFQCPWCAKFAEPIRQLESKGVDGVRTEVRFKHFPLDGHPDAPLAHQAAVAAGEQGKFWDMHDLLFANRASLKRPDLLSYAAKLGLDLKRFESDLDSDKTKRAIAASKAEGTKRGVNGTPTFYLNGKEYSGAKSYEELKKLARDEKFRAAALAEITDSMLSLGPANAPVTVEFFADLQSPVSGPALAVLREAADKNNRLLRIQFRSFPLAFHPQAGMAHEAAMLAARQGKFWEMTAYLLDTAQQGQPLREQDLIAFAAGKLGLDATAFAADLQVHRYSPRVEADLAEGLKRGIRGSPAIVVNGRGRIDGVPSLDTLAQLINEETQKVAAAK